MTPISVEALVGTLLVGMFTLIGKLVWDIIKTVRNNTHRIIILEERINRKITSGELVPDKEFDDNGDGYMD